MDLKKQNGKSVKILIEKLLGTIQEGPVLETLREKYLK